MRNQMPSLSPRKFEIAQRIKQARCYKGWTQQQTASFLGCSRKRYNSMERGLTELGATELDRLADALNVPVEFFFEKSKT
jgi:transcriptional regulator with XRE-family HTH domain